VQIRNFYCRLEKVSQKVCGGKLKLDQKKFGGLRVVGGGDVCHYVIFWGRIRTCFPPKICFFYEIRKLKEEEE
jgi:hypothetical protein